MGPGIGTKERFVKDYLSGHMSKIKHHVRKIRQASKHANRKGEHLSGPLDEIDQQVDLMESIIKIDEVR